MKVLRSLTTLLEGTTAQVPGAGFLMSDLIARLHDRDESVRHIAGISLVKAGARALPSVRRALAAGDKLPLLLTILGDIGDKRDLPPLRALARDPDPSVARAAVDAARLIELRAGLGPNS